MLMRSPDLFLKTHDIDARLRPSPRWPVRLLAALARARSTVLAELRARRAAAELASMDDHMLRDMGVSRSEIDRIVRRPPPRIAGCPF